MRYLKVQSIVLPFALEPRRPNEAADLETALSDVLPATHTDRSYRVAAIR